MAPPKKPNEKKSKRNTAVKKLEEANRRNVTFSKRKAGLFNKLTELSILCQAETALIIASPNDKLFACGYPSADAVIRRFLTRGPPAAAAGENMNDEERLETLRASYDEVQEHLKEEKKNLQEIMEEQKRNLGVFPSWWETSIDEMDLDGLEMFKKSLENFRLNLVMRYNTYTATQPLPLAVVPPPPPLVTNSSVNWQQVVQNGNYYIESGSTSTDDSAGGGVSVTLPPFPRQSVIPPLPLAVVSDNCHGWQEVENGNCIEFESGSTSSDNTGVTLAPFPPSFDSSTNGSVMFAPSGFGQFY
ncbi:agamous-like MADS-box protein AGL28 [Lotus japonicus]|uniref:agamous-like MADS-box protein AGL28 n=1 Tax=Lotus japonicus TaxID=34305 RepID=UPI002584019D|nr:agamous-like MADS-box protein AGL28 [Lotus japonicus]